MWVNGKHLCSERNKKLSFWQRFHYQWQIRWISNICIFRYVFIVGQNHWDSQYKLAIRKLHGREIISNFCLLLKMHDYIKSCNIFSFTVWVIVSHNIDLNRNRVYRNHNEVWPCLSMPQYCWWVRGLHLHDNLTNLLTVDSC